jgi:hypothetical protein
MQVQNGDFQSGVGLGMGDGERTRQVSNYWNPFSFQRQLGRNNHEAHGFCFFGPRNPPAKFDRGTIFLRNQGSGVSEGFIFLSTIVVWFESKDGETPKV